MVLMDKIANPEERKWYIEKSAQNGWSRNVLVHQIESGLYQRQGFAFLGNQYHLNVGGDDFYITK